MNEFVLEQLKNKNYNFLKNIVKELKKYLENNILICNEEQWKDIHSKYSKDDIKDAIIILITEEKLAFPFEKITKTNVDTCFFNLLKENISKFIIRPESKLLKVKNKLVNNKVIEKYVDFKYKFDDYGICLLKAHHRHNDISDFFHQKERHKCGTWSRISSYESWTTGKHLRSNLGALWRMGNNVCNRTTLKSALRLSTYIATQFKPVVAKVLYDGYKTKKIIDISCGWGDRLAGFYTSSAKEYYGFDPNPKTFKKYKEQCIYYEKLLGIKNPNLIEHTDWFELKGNKYVKIYNLPAEDVPYNEISNDIDFIFSSPPYFSTEMYGKNQENEKLQSWSRYATYELWRDNFLFNVIDKCWSKMNTGLLCLNIIDVVIKNNRHRICDDLVEYMQQKTDCQIKGQIGMTMNLRPNTRNNEIEHQDINKIPFIEPIWVFSKNNDTRDILKINNCINIEDMFE